MALKIVVLAKQVPDTRNVGKDAMTAEGTVNRAALPAIFNPEDLNALEQALRLKEQKVKSSVRDFIVAQIPVGCSPTVSSLVLIPSLLLTLWLLPSRRLAT